MSQPALSMHPETFGRYVLYPAIARGGMAAVHPARLVGAEGFSRLVAAKRLHAQFVDDPDFVSMFHDEARIASNIHHPNVVPVLDVVMTDAEVILVQEYVHGVPLNLLERAARADDEPIPIPIIIAIVTGALAGLHAAHEATDELGEPLGIVHRDVSPQNIMVSVDGIPRLLDFGIAKAKSSSHHTRDGLLKGKLTYMAPEQVRMEALTRRTDVYAMGVLLWELLTNRRLFEGQTESTYVATLVRGQFATVIEALANGPASHGRDDRSLLAELGRIVARAMSVAPSDRYATALEMQEAILAAAPAATQLELSRWVRANATELIETQQRTLKALANEDSSRRPAAPGAASGVQRITRTPGAEAVAERAAAATLAPPAPEAHGPSETSEVSSAKLGAIPMKGSWRGPAMLAIALLGAVALGVVLARRPTPPSATAKAPEPQPTPAAPASAAPAPAPEPPVAAPAATTASVTATTTAKAPRPGAVVQGHAATGVAAPLAPAPPGPPLVAPPQLVPAPKVDCSSAFYFDGTKKVFKPGCL